MKAETKKAINELIEDISPIAGDAEAAAYYANEAVSELENAAATIIDLRMLVDEAFGKALDAAAVADDTVHNINDIKRRLKELLKKDTG